MPMQSFSSIAESFGANATNAAAYLDACDEGMSGAAFDPGYYKACAGLLTAIFSLANATEMFRDLLERSAAAREVAESIALGKELEPGRHASCSHLNALLRRINEKP